MTSPSTAAEPSAANTPRRSGVVLNLRGGSRRREPPATPSPASRQKNPKKPQLSRLGSRLRTHHARDAVTELRGEWKPTSADGALGAGLMPGAVAAVGLARPPRAPEVEHRPRGRLHSIVRDARAVRHHYDVSNDFFALFLDDSVTY